MLLSFLSKKKCEFLVVNYNSFWITRYMYWTDWGTNAKIETATMGGYSRRSLVDRGLVWPNGLTMDYEQNLLYWADANLYVSLVILVGIDEISSSLFERRGICIIWWNAGEYTCEDWSLSWDWVIMNWKTPKDALLDRLISTMVINIIIQFIIM